VGNSERKRLIGNRRHGWVNDIKMDHTEIGWVGVDWIELAQVRDQWRVMNLWVP
jgi:hypothetical protein